MRAELELLPLIPSAPRAVGVASPSDLAAQPVLTANGSFGQLLARQLGAGAARTGGSQPGAPPLDPASTELGIDPTLAPVLLDAPVSAPNDTEAEGGFEDSVLALVVPTPAIPAAIAVGLSASGAGATPLETSVESESAGNGDPRAPAAAVGLGSPLRSAIAGTEEQPVDAFLDRLRASARPVSGAAPPRPRDPSAVSEPNPNNVGGPDPRAVARGLAVPPESTVPPLKLDANGRPLADARLRDEVPGTAGPRRLQQETLSAPRSAPAALVTSAPSQLESERALVPGVLDREQPESARALGTSTELVASREAPAPPAPASGERLPPPGSPTPGIAVVQQVEWLAAQGGGTARMRLSPASLGEIELEVRMQQGRVLVFVRAREQAGQQALLAERSAIAQMFGARDLKVSDFVVTPMDGGSASGGADANTGGATTQGREGGSSADGRPQFGTPAAFTTGTALGRRSEDLTTAAPPGRLDVRV